MTGSARQLLVAGVAVVVIALGAALLPSSAVAACTTGKTTAYDNPADQTSSINLVSDLLRAQTFTVPGTVTLDRVGLYLGAINANITVGIYSGTPGGSSTELGSPVTRVVNISGSGFAEFDFTGDPIQLSPGTTYFIGARSTEGWWGLADPGDYQAGSLYYEAPPGTFNNPADVDLLFQVWGTTCTADPTPTPTPTPPSTPTPTPTPPSTSTADTTTPAITASTMSSSVFQAAGSGPAFTAKVGTKVSFSVSEASSVKFTVQRKTTGRRVAGKCRRQTRANRTKRACTRWVAVRGSFTIPAKAGKNSFAFRGRIGGKKLRPGRYRLNSRATDKAGNRSGIRSKSFRIVK
jgi:hypothetical protein